MASLIKEFTQEKLFGKVYTPNFIVDKMLDDIGYVSPAVLGKSILDPACGDGQFLVEIVKRIIQHSGVDQLAANLSYVHGWDIDRVAVCKCIENLDRLILGLGVQVRWNIQIRDSLINNCRTESFDFIVGNPPYVRIQHMDLLTRQYLQRHYICCQSGSTDAFIAFFELSLRLLSQNGVCGFITPNSYLYSRTACNLRNLFITHACIKKISNYGHFQVFDGASTYSAITIFTKQRNTGFLYEEAYSKFDFLSKYFCQDTLRISKPWQLSVSKTIDNSGLRLGDIASIHVGITTLCDKAYIFKIRHYNDSYVIAESKLVGDVLIESELVKPIIKASTFKALVTETDHILLPYKLVGSAYQIIPEDLLKESFPKAYKYLTSIRHLLDRRDNGKPNAVAWYAFGRSQGLVAQKGSKIVFPPISKTPTFIIDDSESLIYSGYCIKYKGDIQLLASQLNSQSMQDYISISSRDFRGGYKGYNKAVVQEFRVQL